MARSGLSRCTLALVVAALVTAPPILVEAALTSTDNVVPFLGQPGSATIDGRVFVAPLGPGQFAVDGGSVLTIVPSGDVTAGLNIGGLISTSEGQGVVSIDGAGSAVETTGPGAFVNVGVWGAGSTGDLAITNGAALRSTHLSVGRGQVPGTNGATGAVTVDGAASLISLSGADGARRSCSRSTPSATTTSSRWRARRPSIPPR